MALFEFHVSGGSEPPIVVEVRPGMTLGRSSSNDLVVDDPMVSRRHAELSLHAHSLVFTDLGSSYGTQINQSRIPPHTPMKIHHGDRITLGRTEIMVVEPSRVTQSDAEATRFVGLSQIQDLIHAEMGTNTEGMAAKPGESSNSPLGTSLTKPPPTKPPRTPRRFARGARCLALLVLLGLAIAAYHWVVGFQRHLVHSLPADTAVYLRIAGLHTMLAASVDAGVLDVLLSDLSGLPAELHEFLGPISDRTALKRRTRDLRHVSAIHFTLHGVEDTPKGLWPRYVVTVEFNSRFAAGRALARWQEAGLNHLESYEGVEIFYLADAMVKSFPDFRAETMRVARQGRRIVVASSERLLKADLIDRPVRAGYVSLGATPFWKKTAPPAADVLGVGFFKPGLDMLIEGLPREHRFEILDFLNDRGYKGLEALYAGVDTRNRMRFRLVLNEREPAWAALGWTAGRETLSQYLPTNTLAYFHGVVADGSDRLSRWLQFLEGWSGEPLQMREGRQDLEDILNFRFGELADVVSEVGFFIPFDQEIHLDDWAMHAGLLLRVEDESRAASLLRRFVEGDAMSAYERRRRTHRDTRLHAFFDEDGDPYLVYAVLDDVLVLSYDPLTVEEVIDAWEDEVHFGQDERFRKAMRRPSRAVLQAYVDSERWARMLERPARQEAEALLRAHGITHARFSVTARRGVLDIVYGADGRTDLEHAFAPLAGAITRAMRESRTASMMANGRNLFMVAMTVQLGANDGFPVSGSRTDESRRVFSNATDYFKWLGRERPADGLEEIGAEWSVVADLDIRDEGVPFLLSRNIHAREMRDLTGPVGRTLRDIGPLGSQEAVLVKMGGSALRVQADERWEDVLPPEVRQMRNRILRPSGE